MIARVRDAARARDDEGTVLVLTLGLTVVVLMLVLVVAAATEVHLQRTRLHAVADELALDAADALDADSYYAGQEPGERSVPLDDGAVATVVGDALPAAADRGRLPQTRLLEATTRDGHTALVTVTARVHPLFGVDALLPFIDGIDLTASASARAE